MTKRYGMVIDLTTCLGCQACSAACSMENETPYWAGKFRTKVEDVERGTFPDVTRSFLPRMCMHCDDAPCEKVCPTGATYTSAEGVVKVDYDQCVGCTACIAACPYGARYMYDETDVRQARVTYGVETRHTVPHVDKCTLCYDRVAEGMEPACVATCPGNARLFGDWNDPQSAVNKAVARAGDKAVRVPGTAIAYIKPPEMSRADMPADQADPAWVKVWKGGAQPAAKAVLGTAVGVLAIATVANLTQKKEDDGHDH